MIERNVSRRVLSLVIVAGVAALLYLLSFGPACAILLRIVPGPSTEVDDTVWRATLAFYRPILWAANESQFVGQLTDDYLDFCR